MSVTVNDYAFWEAQLEGKNPEWSDKHQPCAGYFRSRYHEPSGKNDGKRVVKWEAVAFWRAFNADDVMSWQCQRTKFGDGSRMKLDEMAELFASCCRHAVSYNVYDAFLETGQWPEGVETVEDETNDPNGESDEQLAAHIRARNALAKIGGEVKDYLKKLGHKPKTQEEADKVANYAAKIGKLSTAAEKARKEEKKPHLDAGKQIDANWNAVVSEADTLQKWVKNLNADYIKAEDDRRNAEAAAENARRQAEYEEAKKKEDAQRADAEHFASYGMESAPVEVAQKQEEVHAERTKVGTGSRQQSLVAETTWEIVDARLLLHYLAERNAHTDALLAAMKSEAVALAKEGADVPGLKKIEGEKVR